MDAPRSVHIRSLRHIAKTAGRRLIYWEMYPKEVEAWRRRIGRRAALAPSPAFGGPPPRGAGEIEGSGTIAAFPLLEDRR